MLVYLFLSLGEAEKSAKTRCKDFDPFDVDPDNPFDVDPEYRFEVDTDDPFEDDPSVSCCLLFVFCILLCFVVVVFWGERVKRL